MEQNNLSYNNSRTEVSNGKDGKKINKKIESKEESKDFRENDNYGNSKNGNLRSKNGDINTKNSNSDKSDNCRDDGIYDKNHLYDNDSNRKNIDENNDENNEKIENYIITESPVENKNQIVVSTMGSSKSKI